MDGGVDAAITTFFGEQLMRRVQQHIIDNFDVNRTNVVSLLSLLSLLSSEDSHLAPVAESLVLYRVNSQLVPLSLSRHTIRNTRFWHILPQWSRDRETPRQGRGRGSRDRDQDRDLH